MWLRLSRMPADWRSGECLQVLNNESKLREGTPSAAYLSRQSQFSLRRIQPAKLDLC